MIVLKWLALLVVCFVIAWAYMKVWADIVSPGPRREADRDA